MNLNEMLEMLEQDVTSGMEKTAGENKKVETPEVPNVSKEFTKSASLRAEAEALGAQVARSLLKQAEEESEAEAKKEEEEKKDKKDEGKKEEKPESKENYFEKKEEENMDKKASLVDIITNMLEKSALNEGSDNTAASPAVPNIIQADTAQLVADQDSLIGPTPGTDGENEGGTVNQILDAIVAKAESQGTINPDQAATGSQVGAERQDEDVEKTAAVVALVEAGVDFDQAVDLVKQAEVEIKAEEFEVEKQAAFNTLLEAGIDFDSAAELVKEAADTIQKQAASWAGVKEGAGKLYQAAKGKVGAAAGAVKGEFGKVKADAGQLGDQLRNVNAARKANGGVFNAGVGSTLKTVAKNRAVQYGAGLGVTGAAGAAGYAATREKKAAFDQLIADGIDFETAAASVQQASIDLYGV